MIDANISGAFRGIGLSFHDIGDLQHVSFNNEIRLRYVRHSSSCGSSTTLRTICRLGAVRRSLVGSRNQSKTLFGMFVRFYQTEPEIHHRETPPKSGTAATFSGDGNCSAIFIFVASIHYDFVDMFSQSIAYWSRKLTRIKRVRFWPHRQFYPLL
jgi:hypothetical protein